MVQVNEETAGKTRNLPINSRLKRILSFSGSAAGIDSVRVTSGGQCAKGTCTRRIGSTRHDLGNAADLDLLKDGRVLKFTVAAELPFFEAFVEAAASFGATGIGGGVQYMGPTRIHVGFGSRATWGGSNIAAPTWLRKAANKGWNNPVVLPINPVSDSGKYLVNARSGLRLRSGPGLNFNTIKILSNRAVVSVLGIDVSHEEWAKVDLEDDGISDGYVFKSFLEPITQNARINAFMNHLNDEEGCESDCSSDEIETDDDI